MYSHSWKHEFYRSFVQYRAGPGAKVLPTVAKCQFGFRPDAPACSKVSNVDARRLTGSSSSWLHAEGDALFWQKSM